MTEQVFPQATPEDIALLDEAHHASRLVFLTGFHAIKHALRSGTRILTIVTTDPDRCLSLAASLSPEISETLRSHLKIIDKKTMRLLHPERLHWTEVWGVAERPRVDVNALLSDASRPSPLVVLEDPKNLGNLGASIRTSAALGASGFVVLGDTDPWAPRVIQGGSGAQFMIPTGQTSTLTQIAGPIVVCDPLGEDISQVKFTKDTVLFFGSEREGVSPELKDRALTKVRIPMHHDISSLNLAVSVGIILEKVQTSLRSRSEAT